MIIAHRGNLYGPNSWSENDPDQIDECLDRGYSVEVDVWYNGAFFLGHDLPQYEVSLAYLTDRSREDGLFIHAKNLAALRKLLGSDLNYFWHESDTFTLTSKGQIWTYPNQEVTDKSIIVCECKDDLNRYYSEDVYGICTDYPVYLDSTFVCS